MTANRHCSRPGCTRRAVATLEFNQAQQVAIVGPLQPAGNPHRWDLCAEHAERTTAPQGWTLEFRDAVAPGTGSFDSLDPVLQMLEDDYPDGAEGADWDLAEAALGGPGLPQREFVGATRVHDQPRLTRREDTPDEDPSHPSKRNLRQPAGDGVTTTKGTRKRHLRVVVTGQDSPETLRPPTLNGFTPPEQR